MSNENNNRVLSRTGAHELTKEQSESISGGLSTLLSHIMTAIMTSPDTIRDSQPLELINLMKTGFQSN